MIKIVSVATVALVMMTGCMDSVTPAPQFDVTKTAVQTIDGKNFNIPVGAKASPHIDSDRVIAFYIKSGVAECSTGDVTWVETASQESINEAIRSGDKTIHARLAKEGKIGCAVPTK